MRFNLRNFFQVVVSNSLEKIEFIGHKFQGTFIRHFNEKITLNSDKNLCIRFTKKSYVLKNIGETYTVALVYICLPKFIITFRSALCSSNS